MRVFLSALLPAPDGAGWFVVQEGERPHRCSARECENMAIAYHHTLHVGQEKLWRNRYRCGDHLEEGMEVREGRIWQTL